jgi:hypothetical protein
LEIADCGQMECRLFSVLVKSESESVADGLAASWRDVPGHKNETRLINERSVAWDRRPEAKLPGDLPGSLAGSSVSPVVSGQSSVAVTRVDPFPNAKRSWLRRESLGHPIVPIGKELCRRLSHRHSPNLTSNGETLSSRPVGMIHFVSLH